MSLFGKTPKRTTTSDKVWKTAAACRTGMMNLALTAIKESATPVACFFFEEDQASFCKVLEANKVPFGDGSSASGAEAVIADLHQGLPVSIASWLRARPKASPLVFIFAGRYPLPQPEEDVLTHLTEAGATAFTFCHSLDDSLIHFFGSDRIRPMIESLGIKDDEFLEHSLITAAIGSARRKLAGKIMSEVRCRSASEWFQLNANFL